MDRRIARQITRLILGAGFTAAVLVFFLARAPEENPLGYDPLTNKKYVLELEHYGGKANVASAQFMQWFDSLWHGRPLAGTVAVLTCFAALAFWIGATLPPAEEEPGEPPRQRDSE